MPYRPSPCPPGCPNPQPCATHRRQPRTWTVRPDRGTTAQRGYGSAHQRRRAQVLKRDPFCKLRHPGCTVRSEVADHIVPMSQGGADDLTNLQGVCRHCHAIKSAREARPGAGQISRRSGS